MENFQLLSTTTYKELEEYFSNNLYDKILVGDEKREFVFIIGEYGAVLFHRCIYNYLKDNIFVTIEANVLSSQKNNVFEYQYVKYQLANGIRIKLIIQDEEYNDDTEREESSGFPLQSMLLKFKEIV